MSFIEAVLTIPLMRHAAIAGGLAGICCACLSPLVVLKRMAFIGDGMAHASYGGIGLALFIMSGARYDSFAVQMATLAFSLALGVLIARVTRHVESAEDLGEDSAIGIAFSVSMALGALLLKLRLNAAPQYVPSMDAFLFGSLMSIGPSDVMLLGAVLAGVLAMCVLLHKELLYYAFDSRLAELSGMRAGLMHYLFILSLVLTVTVSARVVGIVLVSASLIVPGVVALRLCKRLAPAMCVAALIGFVSFELGMFASYSLNVPPGSAIVLIQFLFLLIAPLLVPSRKNIRAGANGDLSA